MSYSFYMQQTTKAGAAVGSAIDLETAYSGLHYVSCKGLSSQGKPKNIYSESYAEQSGERIYHPTDNTGGTVKFESTDIEMTILFSGNSRRATYDSFLTLLKSGRLFYWDTARLKKVWLVLKEAVEPTDDVLKGVPYIQATFKFTNLWGEGKTCNASGVITA